MTTPLVFLSHTSVMARYPEGRTFIQAAKDASLRAGLAASDMQYFPAADRLAAEVCQNAVRACQVYIGIFGHDYGSRVRERPEISYTELEFLTALEERRRSNMRVFIFLLRDGVAVGERDTPDCDQAMFRRQVCENHGLTVKFFDNPASLELEVYHALSEMSAAGRRPRPWHQVGRWGSAGIVLMAGGLFISYWLPPKRTTDPAASQTPAPASTPNLKEMTIAVGQWEEKKRVSEPQARLLLKGGVDQALGDLPKLSDRDAFRLYGTFDRLAYWYLAWIDTEGRFEVNDASKEPQTELLYPTDGQWQPVNPADRKGVHLLILITGDRSPAEATPALQLALGGIGRPPQSPPVRWAVRGGGERLSGGSEGTSLDFLAHVRRQLPTGFHVAYSLWLQTQ